MEIFLSICVNAILEALTFQPDFQEPIVNISMAIGRDATFTCYVKHIGGYRVKVVSKIVDFSN